MVSVSLKEICPKSSVELFCFDLALQFFDLLIGEAETLHFYDLGTFGRVPGSPNQLFVSSGPQDTFTNPRQNPKSFFENAIATSLKFWEIEHFESFGKGRSRKSRRPITEIPQHLEYGINILES